MSWELVKLGAFLKAREERFKPDDKSIRGLKRVDKIDFSGNLHISNSPSKTDMILVKKGDLLISGINVGKGAVIVYEGNDDITATIHYSSYRYDKNKIDIEFLKLFLKSQEFLDAIKEQVPGGIKTEIKPKHFLPLEISMPTEISEQRKITEHFSGLELKNEQLSTELTLQLNLVNRLREAFLREATQGKLVDQDPKDEPASELIRKIRAEKEQLIKEKKIRQGQMQIAETQNEILFEIPKMWEWCSLDDLCLNITDGTHQTPTYTKSGRMFLSAQNIKPFRFMPEQHKLVSETAYQDYVKGKKPEKGDLLVTRVGAGIGETAVIDQELDFGFYVSLGLIQPFKKFVNSVYLACVFNSPYGVQYSKGNISSKGGSAGNFNLGRIRSFLVPVPPLEEQQRIVAKLDVLIRQVAELNDEIRQCQLQNRRQLQRLLTEILQSKEVGRTP